MADSGAYSIGHIIVWNAIFLLNLEPEIAAWGILLILLWPVLDTLFALLHRVMIDLSVSRPDKIHYLHVLMRLVFFMIHKDIGQKEANPIGSFLQQPLISVTCALGYHFIDDKSTSVIAIVAFTTAYIVTYHLLVNNALKLRRSVS